MRRRLIVLVALPAALTLGACSSSSASKPRSSSGSLAPTGPLMVLVTNDDGVGAPGIDAVTKALENVDGVQVEIVAPATNQSGTGGKRSASPPSAQPATTASGTAATAVAGYPADAVAHALDVMHVEPDLVVSGINAGQNLGPVTAASGTVGAAEAAASAGIPALAASQGLGAKPAYDVGARYVVAWVRAHRDALLLHSIRAQVVNVNIPTCTSGSVRGVKQVPLATDAAGAVDAADCTSGATDPTTDIEAFREGFVAVTQLSPTGTTVTPSTTFPRVSG